MESWELLLLVSQLYLIEVSVYQFLHIYFVKVSINISCSSVQSLSCVDSLRPHGLQHSRLPCLSSSPGAYTNSCLSSWWCHPSISSSVVPFFSHLQSLPASGSFLISQFFSSGGQSIGVSAAASVLPMNIQECFPLEWKKVLLL